jgi:hypothetical protein
MSPRTFFVIGMGRSGTSTVAGMLKSLGVEWGPRELMLETRADNAKGFWEFRPLHDINVAILNRMGGNWHSPPEMKEGWERLGFDDLKSLAKERIATYFRVPMWGFKDPRCCMTFSFWKSVVENPIECVFAIRNPLEVAYSLFSRDMFPVDKGCCLWWRNMSESWRATQGLRRHLVCYEDVLDSPAHEVYRLERFLGREDVVAPEREEAISFVDKHLRHERASLENLFQHPSVSTLVKSTYAALRIYALNQRRGSAEGEDLVTRLLT